MTRPLAAALCLSVAVTLVTAWLAVAGIAPILGLVEAVAAPEVRSEELTAGTTIGQTFVVRHPGLTRVDVFLASPPRPAGGALVFHLRRASGADADLVTLTVQADRIADDGFYAFDFRPLALAPGEVALFYLEAPQAQPGQAVGVWGQSDAVIYPAGQAFFGSMSSKQIQDLAFQLHYTPSAGYQVAQTLDRLTAGRPGLFGQRWVYLAVGCLYLVLLSWIGLLVMPPAWLAEALAPWFAAPQPADTLPSGRHAVDR